MITTHCSLVILLCFLGAGQQQMASGVEVTAMSVQETVISDSVEALGTLQANESIELMASVTEFVTAIHFEDNQHVQHGDLLVELNAAQQQAELLEQQSIVQEAQRQIERLSPLVAQGAASASALDEARLRSSSAKARIKAIEARMALRVIKAPFSGTLGLRQISVGALLQPNTVITTLDEMNTMKLEVSVPAIFMQSLHPGLLIQASTPAFPDEVFFGKIESVDSRVDPVSRSLKVRAILSNPDLKLKPGLLMQAIVTHNERSALMVAEEALMLSGDQHSVFVVVSDDTLTVRRQAIRIGARQEGAVEVLDGLAEGDQVITQGQLKIRPGSPITLIESRIESRKTTDKR